MEPQENSSGPPEDERAPDFYRSAVIFEMGLGVLALFLGWLFSHQPLATITAESWELWLQTVPDHIRAVGWGVVATLPMLAFLGLTEILPIRSLKSLSEFVEQQLVPLFRNCTWWQLGIIALLAGVGEEMLFRGWLQTILTRWLPEPFGVTTALVLASVTFGVCHAMSRTYFVLATGIGLYLGGLFLWTNNLFAPMVAHALYDFVALLYLVGWKNPQSASEDGAQVEVAPSGPGAAEDGAANDNAAEDGGAEDGGAKDGSEKPLY